MLWKVNNKLEEGLQYIMSAEGILFDIFDWPACLAGRTSCLYKQTV